MGEGGGQEHDDGKDRKRTYRIIDPRLTVDGVPYPPCLTHEGISACRHHQHLQSPFNLSGAATGQSLSFSTPLVPAPRDRDNNSSLTRVRVTVHHASSHHPRRSSPSRSQGGSLLHAHPVAAAPPRRGRRGEPHHLTLTRSTFTCGEGRAHNAEHGTWDSKHQTRDTDTKHQTRDTERGTRNIQH